MGACYRHLGIWFLWCWQYGNAFTSYRPGRAYGKLYTPRRAVPDVKILENALHHVDASLLVSSLSLDDDSIGSLFMRTIQSEESPFRYAFMFPTMVLIATCCQLAGIGGAALLSPLFLLVFPLLGPDYPLPSAASAIASALLTEVFGFASGLSGYWRRGLVDWRVSRSFLGVSIPFALVGALSALSVASNTTLLRAVYAVLMLSLSLYLTLSEKPQNECNVDDDNNVLVKEAADGTVFVYLPPRQTWAGVGATGAGSLLTGLLGVGVGEVVLPQLVRRGCMPLPVAAGSSVAVVVLTSLTAATVQFLSLANTLDDGLMAGLVRVVPWSLVQYTVPGALVGGQVAPLLAGSIPDETIERFTAALFAFIGIAFAIKCIQGQ